MRDCPVHLNRDLRVRLAVDYICLGQSKYQPSLSNQNHYKPAWSQPDTLQTLNPRIRFLINNLNNASEDPFTTKGIHVCDAD